MQLDLSGQTVLVTGATGGIGHGIAEKLAHAQAYTILHTHENISRAEKVATSLKSKSLKALAIQADLTKTHEITTLFSTLTKHKLTPTLLVNNAGLQPVTPLVDMTESHWSAVQEINLKAAFLMSQAFCKNLTHHQNPARAETSLGAIVNIASIEAMDPAIGHAHYAASKAGLITLTRAAALEYGTNNIRVNSISPGLIHRKNIETDWPEGVHAWRSKAPLERLGMPDDIANAVLFLLSDAASWITGTNLVVDGGMSASSRW